MIDKVKKPGDEQEAQAKQQAPADSPAPEKPLSQEAWDHSYKREAWNATPQGRLAIRTFSRGIMGAMFFTAGGLWARKLMSEPVVAEGQEALKEALKYNSEKSFTQIAFEEKNPLQFIAKTIDTFVGKPIESTVNLFKGNGREAVHFKPTKYSKIYSTPGGGTEKMLGRSLGEESVFLTFDFFCASIGDAMGRDIIGWFDPAQKKEWVDEKGHVKWPEAVKSLASTMFRYVTYNGGEDWAVAIPYVYFVKAQRNCIDKYMSPGYGFESDITLNSSSLKMSTGNTPHTVSGSYSLEAILDYQSRFTVYNMGTLLFREAYDKVEQAVHGKHMHMYGAPDAPADKNRGIVGGAVTLAKWMLRGAAKGLIYMTPAVPFFSITRATQGRERLLFIDPNENAAMAYLGDDGKKRFITVQDMRDINPTTGMNKQGLSRDTPVFYSKYDPAGYHGRGEITQSTPPIDAKVGNAMAHNPDFNEYKRRNNLIENAFSRIGETNRSFSQSFNGAANWIDGTSVGQPLKKMLGLGKGDDLSRFTRSMANAAVSYTPYMYAKAEFAKLWDNGKTDLALERTIDGLFAGDVGEMKAGLGETWNAILHKPFADTVREKEAKRRQSIDTSAADDADPIDKTKAVPAVEKLPWAERVVQGNDGAALMDSVSTKHSPQSHAEREAMRKLLEDVQPPTSSIH